MLDDSRIRRAQAFIDDARTSLVEALDILDMLGDEFTNNHLDAARVSANVAISHLNILELS